MKAQDFFPFDSTIYGLNHQYFTIGIDKFMINTKNIIAPRHIISTGDTYLLFWPQEGFCSELLAVCFVDAYFDKGKVSLMLLDINTKEKITLWTPISLDNQCQWILADPAYLQNYFESMVIKAFCNCG
jgi:hypothetical protein